MVSVWATFIIKTNRKMNEIFMNNLVKKAKEKLDSPFRKSTYEHKRASTEIEQQMRDNVIKYCTGTMPELEKKLFEFKRRSDPILNTLLSAYQAENSIVLGKSAF
jgi:hypothetical protein